MSDQNENYFEELLDKFLTGNHSEADLNELKKAASKNPELQRQLTEHIETRANIRIAGEQQLKQTLSDSYNPLATPNKTISSDLQPYKSTRVVRLLVAAACIAGLIFAGIYFWPQPQSVKPVAGFLDNPPVITVRGQQKDEFTIMWKKGEQAYENHNYKEALNYFYQLDNYPEESRAHFGKIAIYKGFVFLQLKQYDNAIEQFKSIPDDNPLLDEATWYLANSYLRKGDNGNARKMLNQIISHSIHYKYSEAKQLLESIQ